LTSTLVILTSLTVAEDVFVCAVRPKRWQKKQPCVHTYICTVVVVSDEMDAIAQKKLVNFVHDLMTRYFDYVCRRVQLEVRLVSVVDRALSKSHAGRTEVVK